MRLLFIIHGEPDYKNDSLTPSLNLNKETCFVSPLGRAVETASYTMEKLGITPHILDWLEEFPVRSTVISSRDTDFCICIRK